MATPIEDLRFEIDPATNPGGHPVTGPYSLDDTTCAAELNVVNRNKKRDFVEGSEIWNNTDDAEYTALLVADPVVGKEDQNQWSLMCGILEIDTGSGAAKSLEARIFGGGTQTRANLAALQNPPASRAVEVDLGIPTSGDVGRARAF